MARMWKKLIQDLIDSGMTQAEIGREINYKQASVSDLYNEVTKVPRWDVGDALMKLHAKQMRRARRAA